MSVVFGQQNRKDYLISEGADSKYRFYHYNAINFMNENLPKNAKVLLWSNDGYYLEKNYIYCLEFITRMSEEEILYNPEHTLNHLKRFGITHVAMTDDYLRKKFRKILEQNIDLDVLYIDNYMKVCSL